MLDSQALRFAYKWLSAEQSSNFYWTRAQGWAQYGNKSRENAQ